VSASAARSAQALERLNRLTRLGGWLFVAGVVVCVVAYLVLTGSGFKQPSPAAIVTALASPYGVYGGGLFALGALLSIAGLCLYVVVPGLDARLARASFDSPRVILGCVAAVFVLANVLTLPVVMSQPRGTGVLSVPALVIAMLATQFALMAVLVWRVVRPGALTWDEIGLNLEHLERRLAQGVVGGFAIFVLAALVALAMRPLGIEQTQTKMFESVRSVPPSQFMGVWLAAAVVAPICEECFFRGYVFGALRGRFGRVAAYAGSAVLFAAIHLNPAAIVPILVMALGLAFLYDRSRSVVPGIIAHGLNNAVAITLLYAGLGG
jgi:membrane protease YdiL (CAAX protease family)